MSGVRVSFEGGEPPGENVASIGVLQQIDSLPVAGRTWGQGREEGEIFVGPRSRLTGFLGNPRQMMRRRILQNEAHEAIAVAIVYAGLRIDVILVLIVRLGKELTISSALPAISWGNDMGNPH